jgi:hypothetical protein
LVHPAGRITGADRTELVSRSLDRGADTTAAPRRTAAATVLRKILVVMCRRLTELEVSQSSDATKQDS